MIWNKEVNAISIGEITALSEFYLTAVNKTIIRCYCQLEKLDGICCLFF